MKYLVCHQQSPKSRPKNEILDLKMKDIRFIQKFLQNCYFKK